MVAMFEHLKKHERFFCFGHLLNLVLKKNLAQNTLINNMITRCRQLVGLFKHSALLTYKLEESIKLFNNPNHMVAQDVPTRWNSSFFMIKSVFYIADSIKQVRFNFKKQLFIRKFNELFSIGFNTRRKQKER